MHPEELLEAETPEPTKIARLSSGIFRREIVHAADATESCVLFVPGLSGDGPAFDEVVEVLNRAGFDVLRFGGWKGDEDLVDLHVQDLLIAIEDTIKILEERGYTFIGYLGKSLGGALGLLGRGKGVERMALWAPGIGLGTTSATGTRFADLEHVSHLKISQANLEEKTVPILLINGSDDPILSAETAEALVAALPNAERFEVQEGHSVERAVETLERTVDFFTH